MARLVLNLEALNRMRHAHGGLENDQDLAAAIGVHATQVSRVLRGAQPGAKFIAGLCELFGKAAFMDLFDIASNGGNSAA